MEQKEPEPAEYAEVPPAHAPLDAHAGATAAGTLGIVGFGTSVGLQILYAAFSLFGEKKPMPADLQAFTGYGRALYLPEREIPLYGIGCLIALLLIGTLHRTWQQRLSLIPSPQRPVFALARGIEHGLLGLVGAFCFFCLIFVERKALHRLPLALIATVLFLGIELAVFSHLLKRSRTLFDTYAQSWLTRHASFRTSIAAQTAPSNTGRNNRFWDLAVPLALFLLIWVPNAQRQAGFAYTVDHFHHWDFFVMAPAVGYRHGGALGTQIYAQYGVGWPVLFATLAPLLPLSYGNLIFVGMAYTLCYYIGIYVCLRYWFRDGKWAAGGVFLAFVLMFLLGSANENAWVTPSSTALRSPCDIWLFFALLIHARTRRTGALLTASVLTGLALLFETDTGVYLGVAFGLYLLLFRRSVSTRDRGLMAETGAVDETDVRKLAAGDDVYWWRICVACGGIAFVVLLAGLWVASRGTLFQPGFFAGWLEVLWLYPSGISLMPIFFSHLGVFASFVMIGAYVGTGAGLLIRALARQATVREGWLLSVVVFGILYMLQFIGRSYPRSPFNVALPFSLLLIIGIKAFSEMFLSGAKAGETSASRRPFSTWAWAGAGLLLLVILPTFRRYPSLLLAFRQASPPATLELLPATRDVLLPASHADDVQQFNRTAQEIRALTVGGRRVAIVSNDDTALYLASDTPLWCRYSPVLPCLITRPQETQIASQLAARTAEWVYILQHDPLPDTPMKLATTETWNHLRAVLWANYRFDHISGKYEVWQK